MNRVLIGGYGIFNTLMQEKRRNQINQSQSLINLDTHEEILPKIEIKLTKPSYFLTTDKKGEIGIISSGNYNFIGIGKTNLKCLIKSDEESILIYSKGDYGINVINPNVRKIVITSENQLTLTICYVNYQISKITNIISDYFKNDKITNIKNEYDNLDENWNEILSLTLNNSIENNNFCNPKIEIVNESTSLDISEIINKYNFQIILEKFKNSNNEIIDDPYLISLISQDYCSLEYDKENLLNWVMNYVENFTIYNGRFFQYYQNIDNKEQFIYFIVSHKIASLYIRINSEEELKLINLLEEVINSNDNRFNIIKISISNYGLVNENNHSYYYDYDYKNKYYSNYYSLCNL